MVSGASYPSAVVVVVCQHSEVPQAVRARHARGAPNARKVRLVNRIDDIREVLNERRDRLVAELGLAAVD